MSSSTAALCSAGDMATAAVTVIAGLGACVVLIIQAFRRDPPWRGEEQEPDG